MSEVTATTDTTVNESSEVTTEVEGEAQSSPTKQEIKSMKEKFKLKVDGEEFEEEIDLADKEFLKAVLQKSKAWDKKSSKLVEEKKKLFDAAKLMEDPEAYLSKLGDKGREAAEKFLLKQIEESMLTPEQKKQRDEMSELEMLRREKKEREEKAKADELAANESKYAEQFQKTIIDALEKVNLPKSPVAVKRMADLLAKNLDKGYELDAYDLAEEYKKEVKASMLALIGDSEGEQLIELFGQDVAKKIRMSDIKRLTEKQNQLREPKIAQAKNDSPPPKPTRPMSMDEWRESINKRMQE